MTNQIKPRDFKPKVEADHLKLIKKDEELVRQLDPSKMIERRKYPESEFRKNFLPIMSGEAYTRLPPEYTPERLHTEATGFWMNVAGGPGYEVEVVESDGRTAFIVPAMMDTSIINTFQGKDKPGLRHLNGDYQNKIIGLPAAADRLLKRGLESHLTTLFTSAPDQKEAKKKITSIFEYYGISKETDKAAENAQQSSNNYMGEMEF